MKRGDRELTFTLRMKNKDPFHAGGSESDESSTPRKIRRSTPAFNRLMEGLTIYSSSDGDHKSYSSSGDDATTKLSPTTPPIYSHRNARRRKGIPRRAPF